MKSEKGKSILSGGIIILNFVGLFCLIYYSILYITHNTTIKNPDAMLPAEAWDSAGMALTIGLIPLMIANVLCFIFVKTKNRVVPYLYFIPSIVCLIMVLTYWLMG